MPAIPDAEGQFPHRRLSQLIGNPPFGLCISSFVARLDRPRACPNVPAMQLTWKDHEEIAWALMDKFPDQDPLKLSFPKLHKMVTELADFGDKPDGSNEKILENIQMTWYEEVK